MELDDIIEEEKLKDPDDTEVIDHNFNDEEDENLNEDDSITGDGGDETNLEDKPEDKDNQGPHGGDFDSATKDWGPGDRTEEELNQTIADAEAELKALPKDEPEEVRECKGLFMRLPVSSFTQNKKYSDDYLKSKGLFKEED